jgi:hypothetical protein
MDATRAIALSSLSKMRLGNAARLIAFLAILATVLLSVPLAPEMPRAGLDESWRYAMNEAVAQHLSFGKEVVFTFGPLAAIYTRLYHPSTDLMMLAGRVLIATAFAIGLALLTLPNRAWLALVIPIMVAETAFLLDAQLIMLPFVLLLLATRIGMPPGTEARLNPTPLIRIGIAVVVCAVGILPLIKGSVSLSVASCGSLTFLVLLRRRPFDAFALALIGTGSCITAWCLAGQTIWSLPQYFLAQAPFISGYSEAMSLNGPTVETIIYLSGCLLLVTVFFWESASRFGLEGWVLAVGLCATLFLAFKAGFVRHDTHTLISAQSILFAGFCFVTFCRPTVLRVAVAFCTVFTWAFLDHQYTHLDFPIAIGRFEDACRKLLEGAKLRLFDGQRLEREFVEANSQIRNRLPLPDIEGSVDSYPSELSTIFAHNFKWDPRPVIQSYAAYTGELDTLNLKHLLSKSAPKHIFFRIGPIDGRLPALEDAGSWSVLLQRYRIVGFDGNWIHFQQDAGNGDLLNQHQPIRQLSARIGKNVEIPQDLGPICAQIKMHETLLGKAVDRLFKLPTVTISLTLADGTTVSRRYIPAMGQQGFLISPFVSNTKTFGKFASGIMNFQNVRSIRIDAPKTKFWRHTFEVTFMHFEMSPQIDAKRFFARTGSDLPAASNLWRNPAVSTAGQPLSGKVGFLGDIDLNGLEGVRKIDTADAREEKALAFVNGRLIGEKAAAISPSRN